MAVLMLQGTASNVGKSFLCAALCRSLHRQGRRVAPFKPQNMALNSAVTVNGGEIGRAQAVQAQACGIEPHTDMNPVLLKPNSDIGAQVIINGHPVGNMSARAYHEYKPRAMRAVMAAFHRLNGRYDVVIVEGAGSPAEINLRDRDIANMGFAEAVDCPVLLVGDIDRGGVFAQLVGTLALLSDSERHRVQGFLINKFRGDIQLLEPGLQWLESETKKPVIGVLPFLNHLDLPAEDGFFIPGTEHPTTTPQGKPLRVVVPHLPRISNHTDLDPLRTHPQVTMWLVGTDQVIPSADLMILPGSKSTRSDLRWLRENGWVTAIQRHLRYGGKLIGICGGFQMLGKELADPDGVEGAPGSDPGLGLFNMTTRFLPDKHLARVTGSLAWDDQAIIQGYEIHSGISHGTALSQPAMHIQGHPHGARSADNQILGIYVHGLFDHPKGGQALLRWAGIPDAPPLNQKAILERSLERLADVWDQYVRLPTPL